MIHVLKRHDTRSAQLPNSFALSAWLEVILWRKFWINNRKSLQPRYRSRPEAEIETGYKYQ